MSALQGQTNDEEKDVFAPEWFANYGLQPFQIRHIDVESTQLLDLETSIATRGYDPKQPIIVARSKDPRANGYVEDGRNRLIICEKIRVKTGKLPDIATHNENVPDLDHAKLRQIYFESQHLTKKTAKVAKEHIVTLYEEIKTSSPQLFQQKTIEEVLRLDGRFDDEVKLKVIIAQLEKLEKQRKEDDEAARRNRQDGYRGSQQRWSASVGGRTVTATGSDKKNDPGKPYTSEVEILCNDCKKTHTYPCNVIVYENGTAKVELLA